jgi:organic radical activating enzyme
MKLVRQGDAQYFGRNRVILVHFEFTGICNQSCSYCLEGNGNPNKIRELPSEEKILLNSLDKIFNSVCDDDHLGFILVGGEPTVQPAFEATVAKILSRTNTFVILTTNLQQSFEYYNKLNIPIVASMHVESADPKEYLEKVKKLSHLVAHVRIMAHPTKMDVVRQAYFDFLDAATNFPISFAVEEIFDYGDFHSSYAEKDLEFVRETKPVECVYPTELQSKLGILNNLFYRYSWFFKTTSEIAEVSEGPDNFKGFYCERNLLIVRADGSLLLGCGCASVDYNINNVIQLPTSLFSTVICHKDSCGRKFGFSLLLPKYSKYCYAPEYIRKTQLAGFIKLITLRMKNNLGLFWLNRQVKEFIIVRNMLPVQHKDLGKYSLLALLTKKALKRLFAFR